MHGLLTGFTIGLALGIVLQRTDFCMHSALRELVRGRPGPSLRAYVLALGFQAVVVHAMAAGGMLAVVPSAVAVSGAVAGGFVFGVGMVLAKG